MENQTDICRDILHNFLDRWPIDEVKRMTLNQYVSVGNSDTFCQWVETRTIDLGNIKGPVGSIKFGIYERRNKEKRPPKYENDNRFSWQKSFKVNSHQKAFELVKNEIIQIIDYANSGKFSAIDNLKLYDIYKWKIAYLYSNERIIPIFKRVVLLKIAKHFGLEQRTQISYSAIQEAMISNKPAHLSIYEYSAELWDRFGGKTNEKTKTRISTRKAVKVKNIGLQERQGASSYVATQKHNILQEALNKKLIAEYGKKNVFMEKNFVDIRVTQPDIVYFYEIKSSSYASGCIREALGQILSYAHRDDDTRLKKLIIAGQYKPNKHEVSYIEYVKKNLKLNFDYEDINID